MPSRFRMRFLWQNPETRVYYHRRKWPQGPKTISGQTWIKISLRTKDKVEAQRLNAEKTLETNRRVKTARQRAAGIELSHAEAHQIAREYYGRLLRCRSRKKSRR
ncbi:MAG: DUF6538 domain-containing protein [Gammaproteobacteria bacterium]